MSFREKLQTFVARCGTPAKFVAKTVVGYAVPGSGPLLDIVEKLIDCAQQTAKDNIEVDGLASKVDLQHIEKMLGDTASKEDLLRIEKMFDVLLGDMNDVVERLKDLEAVPETAKKTLRSAVATEKHCLTAAKVLRALGLQISAVQAELEKQSAQLAMLLSGQKISLELQGRFYASHLDYIEEQRQHNVAPEQLNERLKKMEEFVFANWHSDHGPRGSDLRPDEPGSARFGRPRRRRGRDTGERPQLRRRRPIARAHRAAAAGRY